MYAICNIQGKRQDIGCNCIGPTLLSMNKCGAGEFLKVSNVFLCYYILMICINATIGYGLMRGFRDCLEELVLREAAIIRKVVSDSDAVSATPCFVGFLGQNRFLTVCGLLHMHVREATVIINKYCSTVISDSSEPALHLSDESQNW